MGNSSSVSLDTAPGLALIAVTDYMTLTQQQVLDLRNNCRTGSLGQKRSRPNVSRNSFQKAMMRSRITKEEWHVLEQLFTMWDQDGEDRVDFVDFLAGTSVLACGDCQSLEQVILFALQVNDLYNTQHICQDRLEKLLNGKYSTS